MRALIIGVGSIGRRHLRNLQAVAPEVECIALRRSAEPVEGGVRVVTAIEEALEAGPAFAVVATPSATHMDCLPALIEAGIPTYVEKPVVTRPEHVEVVREALAHSPVQHFSGFNLRMLPSLQRARLLVEQGRLGTIARASFSAGQWLPDWRSTPDFKQNYSASRALGGGVIFDLSHELDAARFLLGEIELASCLAMYLSSIDIATESAASMLGRSRAGGLVTVNVDYVARKPIRRYEIVGDVATLVWDLAARRLEIQDRNGIEILADGGADFDVGATYVSIMRALVDGNRTGYAADLQSLEDGLISTALAIRAGELAGLE